jgi:hypothetical protein
MPDTDSPNSRGMPVREHVLDILLNTRQSVPFKAALVTFRPTGRAADAPFVNHRYSSGVVRHIVDEYIPSSPAFRLTATCPDDVLDWEKLPSFRTTVTARQWLIPSEFCQGASFVLGEGLDGAVGSFHVRLSQHHTSGVPSCWWTATIRSR